MQTSGPQATVGVGPRAGSRAGRSLGHPGRRERPRPGADRLFRGLVDVGGHLIPLTCSQVEKAEGEVVIGGRPEGMLPSPRATGWP
jgi:hypothetical protein